MAATQPDPIAALGDLEALATRIGDAESDRDGALTEMAKGMTAGLRGLLELAKGGKMPPPDEGDEPDEEPPEDEDEDEGGDEDADAGMDDDDDDDAGPGYEDMRMGTDLDPEYVDATDYIVGLEATIASQGKALEELQKGQRLLAGQLAAVLAPMAKGLAGIQQHLMEVPEITEPAPGRASRRARARHALDDAQAAAGGIDVVQLAKARKAGLLNEDELRFFKRHGTLPGDDADVSTRLDAIRAL